MNNKRERISYIICLLVVVLFFAFCLIIGTRHDKQKEEAMVNRWNRGVHAGCGGNFEYQQMIAGQSWRSYVYRCDKCGLVVTFPHQMEFYTSGSEED
jgi:lipopolysaccharide biosynthesis regulator YciM